VSKLCADTGIRQDMWQAMVLCGVFVRLLVPRRALQGCRETAAYLYYKALAGQALMQEPRKCVQRTSAGDNRLVGCIAGSQVAQCSGGTCSEHVRSHCCGISLTEWMMLSEWVNALLEMTVHVSIT
jgi:hypothetical protein